MGLLTLGACRDAFQRREKASEDFAIRQREKEKLLDLKKRLADQKDHLNKLEEHMCVPSIYAFQGHLLIRQ